MPMFSFYHGRPNDSYSGSSYRKIFAAVFVLFLVVAAVMIYIGVTAI